MLGVVYSEKKGKREKGFQLYGKSRKEQKNIKTSIHKPTQRGLMTIRTIDAKKNKGR